jgi:hypothetical protein
MRSPRVCVCATLHWENPRSRIAQPIVTCSCLYIHSHAGPVVSPGALRIQTDMGELELPANCTLHLPNKEDLMNFEVSITPDDGFWCVLAESQSNALRFVLPWRLQVPQLLKLSLPVNFLCFLHGPQEGRNVCVCV